MLYTLEYNNFVTPKKKGSATAFYNQKSKFSGSISLRSWWISHDGVSRNVLGYFDAQNIFCDFFYAGAAAMRPRTFIPNQQALPFRCYVVFGRYKISIAITDDTGIGKVAS